jgi:predicted XRE-type DNA-binding protein
MRWITTSEAAELLKVSPSRVRQIVAKFRNDQALVKRYEGRNYLSESLINKQLESVSVGVSPSVSPNDGLTLEDLEEGVHIPTNGKIVQVFSFEDYETFKEALIERRQLTLALTQEREQRAFLEKQIERKDDLLKNSISAVHRSLDNIHQGLTNIERDQTLKYIEKNSD